MAYKVYLVESLDVDNYIELDCEDVDFTTIFSVADVSDVSKRKDKITKQISFKGTPTNNQAFGSMFFQNMVVDFELENRLYFNYNPLRAVDCLIYEDTALLLRGSLRVHEIQVDGNGNRTYQTVVTGSVLDFSKILANKLTDELSFADLQHRFNWDNIRDSWEVRTERYNTTTSTYAYKPFAKGSGFVYPLIDYGVTYKKLEENTNLNSIPIGNFRPAIYVKEYFDRIFKQQDLSGYTYEINGDDDFKHKFNSLVIPTNVEKITSKSNALGAHAYTTVAQTRNSHRVVIDADNFKMYRYLNLEQSEAGAGLIQPFGNYLSHNELPQAVHLVNRDFTSNGFCNVTLQNIYNNYPLPITVSLQLCQRSYVPANDPSFDDDSGWNVIQTSAPITVPAKSGFTTAQLIEMEIGERTYEETSQLCLRVKFDGAPFGVEFGIFGLYVTYALNYAHMRFPKDNTSLITYALSEGDVLTPLPILGIKQLDFVKSIITVFNLYVYTEKERPKHLIFQKYADFYAQTQPHLLPSNAVDWSQKIDYSKNIKLKSNLQLPQKYLFTWKEDSDELNKNYKSNYSEVYGTLRFSDAFGLVDEKKVELIFSPSPLVRYRGTARIHPAIYVKDGDNKKPTKSNVRLLYYNGVKSCTSYVVGKDIVVDSFYDVQDVATNLTRYPQVGNYWLKPGLDTVEPVEDLYYGLPKEIYFDFTTAHQNCPGAYNKYYRDMITDLTNPNVSFIECEAYLNEVDIANLSLRRPVFVDLGSMGHSYYKVLSVEYTDNTSTSRVLLQKIAI